MPSHYENWGFTDNPFTTRPLQADDIGVQLLVGRETEAAAVLRRLENPPKAVTLEGLNGVGKTSLVNVVVHRAYKEHLAGKREDLFISTGNTFQLDADASADSFIEKVYFEVAQTLLKRGEVLKNELPTSTTAVAKWLNSPQIKSWQAGIQVGIGASAGRTAETNTSQGFSKSGFRQLVGEWLTAAFPNGKGGGVVCVLDNLELVLTSKRARQLLESLRDEVLTVPGLKWVLCGSSGIVRSVVSSPRLEGILHSPIDIEGISDKDAQSVLTSRARAFAATKSPYLPLTEHSFQTLYDCFRGNLRNTLSKSDDYCLWAFENGKRLQSNEEKNINFDSWFKSECDKAAQSADLTLADRAWKTFDLAVERGGSFSPGDYQEFEFESVQALRPSVRDLEVVGLLVSTQDDTDKRRKTIQITPKGWMVSRARAEKNKQDSNK